MFYKYASLILQEISDECMIKSFTSGNVDDSNMYRKIAGKVDALIQRIGVETPRKAQLSEHD
jgi:hypothetical protein